jgi:hypothetical protein
MEAATRQISPDGLIARARIVSAPARLLITRRTSNEPLGPRVVRLPAKISPPPGRLIRTRQETPRRF